MPFLLEMSVAENWRAPVCMSDLPNLLRVTHKSGKENKRKKKKSSVELPSYKNTGIGSVRGGKGNR